MKHLLFKLISLSFIPSIVLCHIYEISVTSLLVFMMTMLPLLYIMLPLAFHYSAVIRRHMIFLTFVHYPFGVDFNKPENLGLPGTRNFYLSTEGNINIGIWHILPEVLIKEAPDSHSSNYKEWYMESLKRYPIIIYLHGNTASRAVAHRVELYKVFRRLDFHVIAFDYRGYADSTSVILSESGLATDAKEVYSYIRKLSGTSPVYIWGHSLGTGVSCTAFRAMPLEKSPNGLILESPFTNIKDEIACHPIGSIFRFLPRYEWFFFEPLPDTGICFMNDINIININCPILILHAEDDAVIPFKLGRKLYTHAKVLRSTSLPETKFIGFSKEHEYGHKFIYRCQILPTIIREFCQKAD